MDPIEKALNETVLATYTYLRDRAQLMIDHGTVRREIRDEWRKLVDVLLSPGDALDRHERQAGQ